MKVKNALLRQKVDVAVDRRWWLQWTLMVLSVNNLMKMLAGLAVLKETADDANGKAVA